MPKIIEEVKLKILNATKEELESVGYDNLKLRNIALKCNIAVGTIYNYFENKEFLVATIMTESWLVIVDGIKSKLLEVTKIDDIIKLIYYGINDFYKKYTKIFDTYTSSNGSFKTTYESYHVILRKQITELIVLGLGSLNVQYDLEELKIVSEILLSTATQEEIEFSVVVSLINKIFK